MDGEPEDGEEGAGDDATVAAAKAKKQRRVSKGEFWATMMPRSRTKFWGNDGIGVVPEAPVKMSKQQQQQEEGDEEEEEEEGVGQQHPSCG